ncbi:MAG TPA: phosphatase PAP2 family protein [Anaerolineae bacterium]|nr:phosphatase PAP2 family protein [Anaerolineae bacterium]HOR00328.1 phosphatase PAP2 family protein [Anaerolineae bacterium]HPL29858.1 phosphatase PAP2 family protein [Anaerolineae bacterium]
MLAWDWALFQALNSLAGRWPAFDGLIRFLMNDYALTTALSALLVVLWFRGRTPEERRADHAAVLCTIVALLIGMAALKGLNLLYFRLRPFTAHDGVTLLFYHPSDSSLPSNAAAVAFTFAAGAARRSTWLGALGAALGVLLGLSRIIGGVHYPLDIVAGALLGVATLALVERCSRPLTLLLRGVRGLAALLYLA